MGDWKCKGKGGLLSYHKCQYSFFLSTFWILWILEMKLKATRSRLWSGPDISFQKYNCGPSREIYTLLVKKRTKLRGRQFKTSVVSLRIHLRVCPSINWLFPVIHSPSLLFANWFCRWRQQWLCTGRTAHKQLIVSRRMDTVIWHRHWTGFLPLGYPIISHFRSTRVCLGWNLAVIGWEHTGEHLFYKSLQSRAFPMHSNRVLWNSTEIRRRDTNSCKRKRNVLLFALAHLYYSHNPPSKAPLHSFIFSPSSRWMTAAWRVPSMLLSPHMSARWNESPELTADGALWVDEARSVCSVHSPCNLSSFFSALLSPKTTEGTLDHHLMRHHLPYVRGGEGGGCQRAQPWAFYPGSERLLADVQFRQGTVGQRLMMWFSDKPGTTGWKLSPRQRKCTKAIRCGV